MRLTDEDLLAMPEDRLQPGALSRLFAIRAEHREKEAARDVLRDWEQSRIARRAEETEREEHVEFEQREAILLQEIFEREAVLTEETAALDKRTMRLADGRRVYVDGSRYVDDEGRELHKHDRAEAEQLHLEQPDAATWREHREPAKNGLRPRN